MKRRTAEAIAAALHRLRTHPFEFLIALITTIVAVQFFIDPNARADSAIGRVLGRRQPADVIWNLFYLIGGLQVFAGTVSNRFDIVAGGLFFVAGAVAIQVVALAVIAGAAAAVQIGTDLIVIGICVLRSWDIYRASRRAILTPE